MITCFVDQQCEGDFAVPREMEDTRALFDGWAASYEQGLQNPQGPLEGHALSLASAARMLDIPRNA